MVPTLRDGQTVVVLPVRLRPPREGDVVVARDPRGGGRAWIKRLAAIGPAVVPLPHPAVPGRLLDTLVDDGQVLLLGDNPTESTDGRQVGPSPLQEVTHVVVWPRTPPWRAQPGRQRGRRATSSSSGSSSPTP